LITIQQLLADVAPIKRDDRYLIAVSGGLDSVVLAHLCWQAKLSVEWMHCNFQLRGDESNRDEQFVRTLAQSWNVTLHVKQFDTKAVASAKQVSIQEAARNLRYEWFEAVRAAHPLVPWVLTAHHRDDLAETVAMNFFRGTGLKGLMGIPARKGSVLRPLLPVSKRELAAYAKENHLQFVEDSSNLKEDYTRNYFRLTLFPAIEKVFPQVVENLVANSHRFTQVNELLQL
jgi:tRNA(Ile)-lysidine synthase